MEPEKTETIKKCPSCDETISVKAKRCPYCRQDLRGWFQRHRLLTLFGIFFITLYVLTQMIVVPVQDKIGSIQNKITEIPKQKRQESFTASVNYTGTEFVISNLDKHPCQDAKMKVNGQYSLEGYNLESALDSALKTGTATVYKVGVGQFTKNDGTRFNPYITKPMNFDIYCRGNNELTSASWFGEF